MGSRHSAGPPPAWLLVLISVLSQPLYPTPFPAATPLFSESLSLPLQLVPKPKSKVQSKKTRPKTASRNPGGATGQGPKRPSKVKKDLPSQGQAKGNPKKTSEGKMVQAKPGAAKEKAPPKANKTKKNLPKQDKVKTGVQKPQGVKAAQPKENTVKEKPPKSSCRTTGPKAKATVQPKTARKAPTSGKPKAMGGKSKPGRWEVGGRDLRRGVGKARAVESYGEPCGQCGTNWGRHFLLL